MEKKQKRDWKYWINEWESYVGTVLFVIVMVLLFTQVVTRYVLGLSFSWLEELATVLYVAMTYCAISAATTHRKHIVVDALVSVLPFKGKRVLMIISNLIFLVFCGWIVYVFATEIIPLLRGSSTIMLRTPNEIVYGSIPVFFGLTAVRVVQDIYRLTKENEKTLGVSEPTIDVDALEREYKDRIAAEMKKNGGGT